MFDSSLLSGVIVTVAVAVVPGIICGRLLNPPGRAATVIPPISNTVSTPNKTASNIRVPLEVPPTPLRPGPPAALPLGGRPLLPPTAPPAFVASEPTSTAPTPAAAIFPVLLRLFVVAAVDPFR